MDATSREIERVTRLSYGRLIALLTVRSGSLQTAEDALGDALLRALERWPRSGVPTSPEAWLLTVARNRILDAARRTQVANAAQTDLATLFSEATEGGTHHLPDRRLQLMLACAHPSIDKSVRAPLMLQAVLGLDVKRMASAFLMAPGTLGQRLTRAKSNIEKLELSFEVYAPDANKIADVLDALYAAYGVGYDGLAAGDSKASDLADEAIWLVGLLCQLLPDNAEAHGLLAIMLYCEARRPARLNPANGHLVPLEQQNTKLWNSAMMQDAEAALVIARRRLSLDRYQLEAAIQAVHCQRRRTGKTDWRELVQLYHGLVALFPTAGAVTGLAAIIGQAGDPREALKYLERVDPKKRIDYQPWWATRAHLCAMAGHRQEALAAFRKAIGLSSDPAARGYLESQKKQLASSTSSSESAFDP